MKVIRPNNPKLAVAMAEALQRSQVEGLITAAEFVRAFPGLLTFQDYTFVGYFDRENNCIIDEEDKKTGVLQPGDSFVED